MLIYRTQGTHNPIITLRCVVTTTPAFKPMAPVGVVAEDPRVPKIVRKLLLL
jgi:hypothetical protein